MIKEILRCACAFCFAASVTACSPSKPSIEGNLSSITILNPSKDITPLPSDVDWVARYYPELEKFRLTSSGQLTTKKGVAINWFNYSSFSFNQEAAAIAFSYFQDIMPKEGRGVGVIYKGKQIPAIILPREGDQARALFITPPNAPKSSKMSFGEEYPSAMTQTENRRAFASYIHILNTPPPVGFFTTPEAYANRGFAVEACQSFVISGVAVGKGETPPSQKTADDIQEAICNSLGLAYALKQEGVPYDLYSQIEATRTDFDYQLIKLGSEAYNNIPIVGKILTALK